MTTEIENIQKSINEKFDLLVDIITTKPYINENILICENIFKSVPGIINILTKNNNSLIIEVLTAHEKSFQTLNWFIFLIKKGGNTNDNKFVEFLNKSRKSAMYKEILSNLYNNENEV